MSHKVVIEPLGREVVVAENQSILEACLRQGVWVPHACTHGTCGTCKAQILDGEVQHRGASEHALMEFEREDGKALLCSAYPITDLEVEADVEADPEAIFHPVRDFSATVEAIEEPARDVRRLILKLENGPIEFLPGQYIQVNVPQPNGETIKRCYSIASSPCNGSHIELQIKRTPGGRAARYIFEELHEGSKVSFSGPYGFFFLRKQAHEPVIFLAGGTGLAPIKSMLRVATEEQLPRKMILIHGVRSQADLYDYEFFRKMERENPNFHYYPALSAREPGEAWDGEEGFVHDVLARVLPSFKGHKAYLCGPPLMVDACLTTLIRGRLFEDSIYCENFFNEQDKSAPLKRSPLFRRI
ncbi:MAG TPA: 2Fe-2S iron-sulfur cluster-binding protein [Chloroflexia bacterium]|nr:2Fe-2S iron-sulfur cluster-binding protein [Chloroflexia bacterium]